MARSLLRPRSRPEAFPEKVGGRTWIRLRRQLGALYPVARHDRARRKMIRAKKKIDAPTSQWITSRES